MKKSILVIVFTVTAFTTQAQIADSINWQRIDENMYCITGTNGKFLVVHNGESKSADVQLKSGAKISSDGIITWKDNSQSHLINGNCVDESGAVYSSGNETKLHRSKSTVTNQQVESSSVK